MNGELPESVEVSSSFDFSEENCALFNFGCTNGFGELIISHFVRRWDTVVLMFVMYSFVVFVLIGISLVTRLYK